MDLEKVLQDIIQTRLKKFIQNSINLNQEYFFFEEKVLIVKFYCEILACFLLEVLLSLSKKILKYAVILLGPRKILIKVIV